MYIDIFILVVALWAVVNGWRNGFLKELTSGIGWLIGLLIAATCYSYLGKYLTIEGTEVNVATNVIAFFILWILVPIVLGFAATVLTSTLKTLKLNLPNRLFGVLVSLIKYVVLLSCALYVMNGLQILDAERTEGSVLYEPTKNAVSTTFKMLGWDKKIPNSGNQAADGKRTYDFEPGDTIWVDMTKPKKNGK